MQGEKGLEKDFERSVPSPKAKLESHSANLPPVCDLSKAAVSCQAPDASEGHHLPTAQPEGNYGTINQSQSARLGLGEPGQEKGKVEARGERKLIPLQHSTCSTLGMATTALTDPGEGVYLPFAADNLINYPDEVNQRQEEL